MDPWVCIPKIRHLPELQRHGNTAGPCVASRRDWGLGGLESRGGEGAGDGGTPVFD